MATLKEIIQYSKANPNTPYAKRAAELIANGDFDKQAQKEGVDLTWAGRPKVETTTEKIEKVITPVTDIYKEGAKNVMEDINKAGEKIANTKNDLTGNLIEKPLIAAKGVADVATDVVKTAFEPIAKPVSWLIGAISDKISDIPAVQRVAASDAVGKILNGVSSTSQTLEEAKAKHPELADAFDTLITIGGTAIGEKPIQSAVESVGNTAKNVGEKVIAKTTEIATKVDDSVTKMIAEKEAAKLAKAVTREFEAITPKTSELTPTEYEKLLSRGKITPKTASQPAQYILSDSEKAVATKYKNLLQSKDPVKNAISVIDEISNKDQLVGDYLAKNNGIFNNGELKNTILEKIADITDVTVDETRLIKAKELLAENFAKNLKKNDMVSLWKARKEFDQQIEKAFTGAPSLQNSIKREFRNAVQDFISERTDDVTYKALMKDMTELFRIKDTIATKATKERAQSGIGKWIKDNPKKAKVIGWGTSIVGAGGLGGLGWKLFAD